MVNICNISRIFLSAIKDDISDSSYYKYNDFVERIKNSTYSISSLLEDHILNQMITKNGGIADETGDHIERSHQVGKCFDQRCKYVTDFTQSQTSQIKLQDLLTNPIVKMKSEEIK